MGINTASFLRFAAGVEEERLARRRVPSLDDRGSVANNKGDLQTEPRL